MQKIDRKILARELRNEIALLKKLLQGETVLGLELHRDGITPEWIQRQIDFNQQQLETLEADDH